jgi:hypothetical protein
MPEASKRYYLERRPNGAVVVEEGLKVENVTKSFASGGLFRREQ